MYYKYLILSISLLAVISCKQEKKYDPLEKDTVNFNKYLHVQFNTTLGDDSTVYVVTSVDGCSSCLDGVFKSSINKLFKKNVRVIISNNTVMKYELEKNKAFFWVDDSNHVDKLPYHKGNVAIIKTAAKKVYSVQPVEPFQAEQMMRPLLLMHKS